MKRNIKKSLTFLSFSLMFLGNISIQGFDLESALKDSTTLLLSQNSEKDQIIKTLHAGGITIYTNWDSFMPNNTIRRDEAAKMLTLSYQFLTDNFTTTGHKEVCEFIDLKEARDDLKDIIKVSCDHGLFQGYQGKFMPKDSLTNGQILTVVGRMFYGKLDENQGHFAKNYALRLDQDNYLTGTSLGDANQREIPAKRGDLAIILGNILK